jgi:hypothetical protein
LRGPGEAEVLEQMPLVVAAHLLDALAEKFLALFDGKWIAHFKAPFLLECSM